MRPYVVAWLERFLPPAVAQVLAPTWFTMVGVAGLLTLLVLLRRARADGVDRGSVATVVLSAYLAAGVSNKSQCTWNSSCESASCACAVSAWETGRLVPNAIMPRTLYGSPSRMAR